MEARFKDDARVFLAGEPPPECLLGSWHGEFLPYLPVLAKNTALRRTVTKIDSHRDPSLVSVVTDHRQPPFFPGPQALLFGSRRFLPWRLASHPI